MIEEFKFCCRLNIVRIWIQILILSPAKSGRRGSPKAEPQFPEMILLEARGYPGDTGEEQGVARVDEELRQRKGGRGRDIGHILLTTI